MWEFSLPADNSAPGCVCVCVPGLFTYLFQLLNYDTVGRCTGLVLCKIGQQIWLNDYKESCHGEVLNGALCEVCLRRAALSSTVATQTHMAKFK